MHRNRERAALERPTCCFVAEVYRCNGFHFRVFPGTRMSRGEIEPIGTLCYLAYSILISHRLEIDSTLICIIICLLITRRACSFTATTKTTNRRRASPRYNGQGSIGGDAIKAQEEPGNWKIADMRSSGWTKSLKKVAGDLSTRPVGERTAVCLDESHSFARTTLAQLQNRSGNTLASVRNDTKVYGARVNSSC